MKKMPSVQAMEILAVSDQSVFESLMCHVGLQIEGEANKDPLKTQAQTESIAAIASEITEETQSFIECDPRIFGKRLRVCYQLHQRRRKRRLP